MLVLGKLITLDSIDARERAGRAGSLILVLA